MGKHYHWENEERKVQDNMKTDRTNTKDSLVTPSTRLSLKKLQQRIDKMND